MSETAHHSSSVDKAKRHWSYWIATFGGVGMAPKAPGTWGSVAGTILAVILGVSGISLAVYTGIIVVLGFIGVWASSVYMQQDGVSHDAGEIVIDEVVGVMLVLFPVWAQGMNGMDGFNLMAAVHIILGFGLFRLLDIWKPYPICTIDRQIKGGLGVMMDDVLAGVIAYVLLMVIMIWALPALL